MRSDLAACMIQVPAKRACPRSGVAICLCLFASGDLCQSKRLDKHKDLACICEAKRYQECHMLSCFMRLPNRLTGMLSHILCSQYAGTEAQGDEMVTCQKCLTVWMPSVGFQLSDSAMMSCKTTPMISHCDNGIHGHHTMSGI